MMRAVRTVRTVRTQDLSGPGLKLRLRVISDTQCGGQSEMRDDASIAMVCFGKAVEKNPKSLRFGFLQFSGRPADVGEARNSYGSVSERTR